MPQPPPWGSPNDNAIGKRADYRRVLRSLAAVQSLLDELQERGDGDSRLPPPPK